MGPHEAIDEGLDRLDKIATAIDRNTEQMIRIEAAIRMHAGQESELTWVANRMHREISSIYREKRATK